MKFKEEGVEGSYDPSQALSVRMQWSDDFKVFKGVKRSEHERGRDEDGDIGGERPRLISCVKHWPKRH